MEDACLIMLAAYNSEAFLREQIDSIINQTFSNWKLVIRDDGSRDNTVEIVKDYMQKDSRIELICNTSERHGAYLNFYALIDYCRQKPIYDYYLFCDHDDIWLPEKIEVMLKECHKRKKSGRPLLVYGDLKLIDAEGNIIVESVDHLMNTSCISKAPISVFFQSNVHGCNMIFDKELFQTIPVINLNDEIANSLPHDVFYPEYAAIKGDIGYVYKPLMLYRRYGGNASKQAYSYGLGWYFEKLSGIKEIPKKHAKHYNLSLYAIKRIRETELTSEEINTLNEIEAAIRKGGFYSVYFCIKNNISAGKLVRTINRYLILFSKLYKKYLVNF